MQMDIDNEQKSMRESEKAVESLMKEHKQLEGKIEEIRKSLER